MRHKIVFDVNSVVPKLVTGRTTGIGRTTLELISHLAELKNEFPFNLQLYSQNIKGIGSKQLDTPFKSTHFFLPHREKINKLFSLLPIKESLLRYDLMHIPHNYAHVYSPHKTLITLHDALFMRINENEFQHLKMRKEVPALAQRCKGIVTCSEASKLDIAETMQVDPAKIEVIYWGVNHHVFKPLLVESDSVENKELKKIVNKPYFLSVSCNDERKNTHKLVEAYLSLAKRSAQNDLVLVWGNPPAFLIDRIEKSGLQSRIHFLSNISDNDLAVLYNKATSMVFPSSYEGFGLPVLEAMACGCPVITCSNSSLPEVGGQAAIYLKSSEPSDISIELENFENENYNRQELIRKGIEQSSKFQWGNTARDYLNWYKSHLNQI